MGLIANMYIDRVTGFRPNVHLNVRQVSGGYVQSQLWHGILYTHSPVHVVTTLNIM